MSALTKLFVVLNVVGSLLLAAATVVFVNRTEQYRVSAEEARSRQALAERQVAEANSRAAAAQGREAAAVERAGQVALAKANDVKNITDQLNAKTTEIAQLQQQLALAQASGGEQATALRTVQENLKAVNDRNKTLVDDNGKLMIVNAEQAGRIADLEKQVVQAERERRWLNEQLAQAKSELTKAQNLLITNKINPNDQPTPRPTDVKGLVRNVQIKDGIAYAMINIGAADKVEKGMKMTIVDQDNKQFLGFLTVDSVDQNTAFGRLEGPEINRIRPDALVLSQL